LHAVLGPLAQANGIELVAAEVCGHKGSPIVRVYLDRDGGIDLEAIGEANAWISEALEESPPVQGPYVLEVSSPGVDRPLRGRRDFERYVGTRATVKTLAPIDGRKRFTGPIAGTTEERVQISCDGGTTYEIPFDAIAKANLKPDIGFSED
jgi:ribosome maturation factor RimP